MFEDTEASTNTEALKNQNVRKNLGTGTFLGDLCGEYATGGKKPVVQRPKRLKVKAREGSRLEDDHSYALSGGAAPCGHFVSTGASPIVEQLAKTYSLDWLGQLDAIRSQISSAPANVKDEVVSSSGSSA